jgi:hypothetical protein
MFSMMVSACLFFAGRLVVGSGGADVRPLAKPLGVAMINDCKVTGRIEGRTNGVYAVFDFSNPAAEDKEIAFNYLVSRTMPMSPMSRMGPRPQTIKAGAVSCQAKPGNSSEEVLVQMSLPVAASNPAPVMVSASLTGLVSRFDMQMTPETWSLVISREAIKGVHGWGAVLPATSDVLLNLDKGEVVLASTVQEKAAK